MTNSCKNSIYEYGLNLRFNQQQKAGERVFLANNNWVGDPAFGFVKSLYILWQDDQGTLISGVVPEKDPQGITLP